MKGMEHMPTVSGKILSVEEETKLLQPIDSYVNEIQKKVDDLRADGTTRIVELQSSIDATKNDRVLTKAERDEAINKYKAQMEKAAAGLFGSGWVWLAEDKSGKLAIVSEQNAGNPLRYGMKPLMCFDVWEHAYYIDYRNRRADAVAALWDRIDWKVVEERYAKE